MYLILRYLQLFRVLDLLISSHPPSRSTAQLTKYKSGFSPSHSSRLILMSLKILFHQYNNLVALIINIYSTLVVNSKTISYFQDL
jgi:hypothetical protein